ncbi:hypothetical protein WT06_22020 [Burkholderia anthina]|uniref:hypothetical protein n=1 Tax=Burkholderia anthina TaxID=179879 RepID=UPI0007564B0F|nr:hypothetical protein [Burkholderia anthina]KVM87627.1 hypothetical protein WT06_22020 [Burkholderia anthina]
MAEATIAGVIVGGAISCASTIGITFAFEYYKQRRDAKNLALSFKGSIAAILSIVEERQYVKLIDETVATANSGKPFGFPIVRARRNYVELYNKNVERIGILHPLLAEKIPVFYTYVNSLLEDLESAAEGDLGGLTAPLMLKLLLEFQTLLAKTLELGSEIIAIIDSKYSGPVVTIPG